MDVKDISVTEDQLLRLALLKMDSSGLGSIFVVNDDNVLVGLVTDGDIRRWLLTGLDLSRPIKEIMNKTFISLPVEADISEILNQLNEKIKVLPLVDKQNRLVDYATNNKIRRIPVSAPLLNGNELLYVTECIKTSWVSSQGKFVKKFEELFSNYHGNRKALAVSNGTVALHLALEALNIGEGDEVLVPDLTFAASVNSIIYTGAKPVFIDVNANSWNIDVDKIEERINSKTKAIMVVHLYGLPCEMNEIVKLAKKYDLFLIEDCAEALGSYYNDYPVGTFGDVATYSFFGNKTITTGEGGMVVFKDEEVANFAAVLRDHGMSKSKRYWHDFVGYNYRITNLQAAIGVAQFERLDEFVSAKKRIAEFYDRIFNSYSYFQTPLVEKTYNNSYWLYTCLIRTDAPFERSELMEYLLGKGVETRPVFYPIHKMPPYEQYVTHEISQSIDISNRGISFPSSSNLTNLDLEYIKKTITSFLNKFNN
jgi:perosamine synthetase